MLYITPGLKLAIYLDPSPTIYLDYYPLSLNKSIRNWTIRHCKLQCNYPKFSPICISLRPKWALLCPSWMSVVVTTSSPFKCGGQKWSDFNKLCVDPRIKCSLADCFAADQLLWEARDALSRQTHNYLTSPFVTRPEPEPLNISKTLFGGYQFPK